MDEEILLVFYKKQIFTNDENIDDNIIFPLNNLLEMINS